MNSKNYDDGYSAGRNEWKYDLSKKDNQEYNKGWQDGVEALRQWDVMNNAVGVFQASIILGMLLFIAITLK